MLVSHYTRINCPHLGFVGKYTAFAQRLVGTNLSKSVPATPRRLRSRTKRRDKWYVMNPLSFTSPLIQRVTNCWHYSTGYLAVITGVQLTACSVQIKDIQIQVSAETRQPVSNPSRPETAAWTYYTPPQDLTISDSRLQAV